MGSEDFGDDFCEVGEAGVWNDDGVSASLVLLGDAEEATAVVLADLEAEELPFDLKLAALEDIVPGLLAVGVRVGGFVLFVHGVSFLKAARWKIKRINRVDGEYGNQEDGKR